MLIVPVILALLMIGPVLLELLERRVPHSRDQPTRSSQRPLGM
jgi:hypothetical protein